MSSCNLSEEFSTLTTTSSDELKNYLQYVDTPTTATPEGRKSLGQVSFLLDDFGGLHSHNLNTVGAPWKIYSTALMIEESSKNSLPFTEAAIPKVLEKFGFIFPSKIKNWDESLSAPLIRPLGMTTATLHGKIKPMVMTASNLNCSACHVGNLFDSQGYPTREVWMGLPNSSIDFEAYVSTVYRGLTYALHHPDDFLIRLHKLYPKTSVAEWAMIKLALMPRLKKEVGLLERKIKQALPFSNGGPGVTNGVAALKYQVGLIPKYEMKQDEISYTSIPALFQRSFRSSLLSDGAYALPGEKRFREIKVEEAVESRARKLAQIVSFFTIPSQGNSFEQAALQIPKVKNVMSMVQSLSSPKFPGRIDSTLSKKGFKVYQKNCQSCHGVYESTESGYRLYSFPNRLVGQSVLQTDPKRWQSVDDRLLQKIKSQTKNPIHQYTSINRQAGYVAPLLSGIWATAPYLHNGSIPTLWHLLNPSERPKKFLLGGHKLNFHTMGIDLVKIDQENFVYPNGYQPWSKPALYDTVTSGRSNQGHTFATQTLTRDQKMELIEFLKEL